MGDVIELHFDEPTVLDGLLCDVDEDGMVTFFTREWPEGVIREAIKEMGEP